MVKRLIPEDFLAKHNFEETEFVWRKELTDGFIKLDKGNWCWYFDGKLVSFEVVKELIEG